MGKRSILPGSPTNTHTRSDKALTKLQKSMICVPIGEESKTQAAHAMAELQRSDIDQTVLKIGTTVATGMIRFYSVKVRQVSQTQQLHREKQGKTEYCAPIGANTRIVHEDPLGGIDKAGRNLLMLIWARMGIPYILLNSLHQDGAGND